nr:iron ABC transporter permease [uncultured Cohaesibacter sp.]
MTFLSAMVGQRGKGLSIREGVAFWLCLVGLLLLTLAFSLGVGRFFVPLETVLRILVSHIWPLDQSWGDVDYRVVTLIRMPRVFTAAIVGAGLALAGAALQGTFRNPLVEPQNIGVSSGAAFGGVLAILLSNSNQLLVASAFLFGLLAMVIVYLISRVNGRTPILMLILSGVVTSAFFLALVSLIKYVADPDDKLPAIVYWLMGSFARAGYDDMWLLLGVVGFSALVIYLLRFRINLLSLGDEEAQALGVRVELTRWLILVCVTLITATSVAVAGVVGWVGLVVPHIARMIVGPDNRILLPASALIGAVYLVVIDDVARAATASEIPLGVITAIIGAPVFALLLRRNQAKGWKDD